MVHAQDPFVCILMVNHQILKHRTFFEIRNSARSLRVHFAFTLRSLWTVGFDLFSELKKNIVYSFDAEKAYLSIGDIFRAIRATQVALEENKGPWYKTFIFFPYIEQNHPYRDPISEIFCVDELTGVWNLKCSKMIMLKFR